MIISRQNPVNFVGKFKISLLFLQAQLEKKIIIIWLSFLYCNLNTLLTYKYKGFLCYSYKGKRNIFKLYNIKTF